MNSPKIIRPLTRITWMSVLIVFCLVPKIAHADAPQDLKIHYDVPSQILTVSITHKSSFPRFHYIKSVEVKKNTTVVITNAYDTQPKDLPFTYTYKVEASKGDTLEVTASCNLSGSKTATLIVSSGPHAGK